jgi:hypothetical protein
MESVCVWLIRSSAMRELVDLCNWRLESDWRSCRLQSSRFDHFHTGLAAEVLGLWDSRLLYWRTCHRRI